MGGEFVMKSLLWGNWVDDLVYRTTNLLLLETADRLLHITYRLSQKNISVCYLTYYTNSNPLMRMIYRKCASAKQVPYIFAYVKIYQLWQESLAHKLNSQDDV